ncbi:hypothetical protein FUA19_20635 [Bacillus subtilis]|nr:hypothetical protein CDO84_03635 [Bacillus sp. MD-5]AUZ37777.1 hypothetical protein C1T29_05465 [Bacillus sp. MBGLi79]NLS41394.1 hypothetical protein [Bacillus subtilis]POO78834.1 hypothetical protein C1T30_29250 [Bacillus sp. MBGLi97]PTU27090.1 hypothetical protein DA469_13560 [Bacillus subtilis]
MQIMISFSQIYYVLFVFENNPQLGIDTLTTAYYDLNDNEFQYREEKDEKAYQHAIRIFNDPCRTFCL